MGYLYRPKLKSGGRSEVWWCKYYQNGRPVRESTGVNADTETPPQEAKRFLKEREGRVATGQPILPRADRIRYEEPQRISALTTRRRAAATWMKPESGSRTSMPSSPVVGW